MAEPSPVLAEASHPPRTRLTRIAVSGAVAATALGLLASQLGGQIPRFAAWIEGLGFWMPLARRALAEATGA